MLVVAGGWDGGRLSSMEVLEPGATSWVAGPALPRWVVQGVQGGAGWCRGVQGAPGWCTDRPPRALSYSRAGVVGGSLLLTGGHDGATGSYRSEVTTPTTGTATYTTYITTT